MKRKTPRCQPRKLVLSIEAMQDLWQGDVPYLIALGYEQAECNARHTVDFEDALCIFAERCLEPVHPTSAQLYISILRLHAAKYWRREFPRARARLWKGGVRE